MLAIDHSAVDYSFLRRIVHAHSNNVLDASRDSIFDARLAGLVRARGMSSLRELIESLRRARNSELELAVADAMTINETSFFRDGRPFELLRSDLLPKLIEARRPVRALRLWSAACATGQEPYSLAMLVRENFPHLTNWDMQIEGTDVCRPVLERARSGRYARMEVNRGLPARMLIRYFKQEGDDWVIKPELRAICRFQYANLCKPPLPVRERFDVIFLRNVMLYFAGDARRSVLAQIHRLLAPDGVLFLGSSEQPVDMSLWSANLVGGTCYFRPKC
ncbi:MAG TPA: protein-glutamate O-methyltransferase CheR [Terracidiphilus sp.]|jgi:chemotaxis protein methyltransferase CheR